MGRGERRGRGCRGSEVRDELKGEIPKLEFLKKKLKKSDQVCSRLSLVPGYEKKVGFGNTVSGKVRCRLRVVHHFSSGIVGRAKRERA